MRTLTSALRAAGCFAAAATLCVSGAGAGELSISWAPNPDDVTAGYDVEVLDSDGGNVQLIDAKTSTHITVSQLADGASYKFRVRPYDRWGQRAAAPSSEIVTLPAPRIDAIEGPIQLGVVVRVSIVGVNFGDGARLVSRRAGLTVVSASVQSQDRIAAQLRCSPESGAPLAADLLVVNRVRRSEDFIFAHPELLDVDHSGVVDETDLALIARSFGARIGDARHAPEELDVDGSGLVDGEDQAILRAYLAKRASQP